MIPVKIVITGDFNAGKTTWVKTMSQVPIKTADQPMLHQPPGIAKTTTTIDMDYGLVRVDSEIILQLFGTPGQARFEFMWELLARGMAGYVVMFDSSRPATLDRTNYILDYFAGLADVPFVVAANKQDCGGALPAEYIRYRLNLPSQVPVIPCIAYERADAKRVLIALIQRLQQKNGRSEVSNNV